MKRRPDMARCEAQPSQLVGEILSWKPSFPVDRVPSRGAGTCDAPLKGFSLLEVLIVVGIILLLTTLYWNGTTGKRQRSKTSACLGNLEKMYMAMSIYENDFAGKYPVASNAQTSGQGLSLLVPKYTVDTSVFICPASADAALPEGAPFPDKKISYAYYMGLNVNSPDVVVSDRQVDANPKLAGQLVFSADGKPPGNNHAHGGNLLYCDGHMLTIHASAPFPLPVTNGVVLLNP